MLANVATASSLHSDLTLTLPALDDTYGALFLGTAFGLMLYGLTMHQTYRYFCLYPTDARLLIGMVIAIWLLETFHTFILIYACYFHLVSNYFKPLSLLSGHWSTRLVIPTSGATILICQCFYARRVWYFGTQYRFIVIISAAAMVALLGSTIAATVEGFMVPLSDFRRFSWLVSMMFGLAMMADILLTAGLVISLLRNRTGFKRTDSVVEVLVMYTINTGLMSTIFGVLGFIFAIVLPGNFIYIGISIVGTKVYATSVLAVLNSRRALSNRILEGFEMGSVDERNIRPHTAIETWNVCPNPHRDTRITFPTPLPLSISTNGGVTSSSYDSSSAHGRDLQLTASGGFPHSRSKNDKDGECVLEDTKLA